MGPSLLTFRNVVSSEEELDGFLGRPSHRVLAKVVSALDEHCAKLAGLDPAGFAGHSLRAGLATAAASGVGERIIMRRTRHVGVTVRRYIRDGEMLAGNASGRVGL